MQKPSTVDENKEGKPAEGEVSKKNSAEEVVDIDLNDPAVEEAAIKIQAQFKGFMVRKEKEKESHPSE